MKTKNIVIVSLSFLLAVILCFGAITTSIAKAENENLKIQAKSALLMDYNTGTVVFEQNAKEHLPIASMVKIMTLLIAFEHIDSGTLSLNSDIIASETATSMGGSQAFLDTNNSYKTSELIKSIIVASANDSCVAIAEQIAGSVDGFVELMNKKAASLKMDDTHFVNCTGLPAPGQYSCAADVAVMTQKLLSHKDYYEFSNVWMFDFKHPSGRITALTNTNKLIKAYDGCDGGKTGFTTEAKSCLSATAKRGNTRLISVVVGAENSKIRNGENAKLFNYGFANYETKHIVKENQILSEGRYVNLGKKDLVEIKPMQDFYYFARKANDKIEITENIGELNAPLKCGDIVGSLDIVVNGKTVGSVDVTVCEDVGKIGFIDIIDKVIEKW